MSTLLRRYRVPFTILFVLLFLALAWAFNAWRDSGSTPPAQNSVTVRRGSLAAFVSAPGTITSAQRARLAFAVSGTVVSVTEPGSEMAAGQPLAEISNPELQLRLDEAQAALDGARAQHDESTAGAAQSEIDAAQAQLQAAQLALSVAQARLDDIAPENQSTSNELVEVERARASVRAAQATLEQALEGASDEALAATEAQVRQAEIRLRLAQTALEATTLTAPFAGVVTERAVFAGERVTGGQLVVAIADPNALYLAAEIDEVDVGRIAEGQRVTITVDAFPTQPLGGTVSLIAPAANPQRGTTVYPARIALDETPLPLRLDMSADAQIRTADEGDVLLLPQGAIRYAENQPYVLVQRGRESVPTPVTLGAADDRDVVILAGLNEGDVVIFP